MVSRGRRAGRNRRGAGNLGCLTTLLFFTVALYYGATIGEAWWRYYRIRDAMRGQAKLASRLTDDAIRHRLLAMTDTLDLPAEARRFRVERSLPRRSITITTQYDERVLLPFVERTFTFRPRVTEPL